MIVNASIIAFVYFLQVWAVMLLLQMGHSLDHRIPNLGLIQTFLVFTALRFATVVARSAP